MFCQFLCVYILFSYICNIKSNTMLNMCRGPEQYVTSYQGSQVRMCQDISIIGDGKSVSVYSQLERRR